jgi:hypothetical protein
MEDNRSKNTQLEGSSEAEEWLLLEAATRKRLVKTLQAGKYLPGAVVICKVWKSAIPL